MTIINHGSWTRYVPAALPADAPANAMFCKRDADGVDWYTFIYDGASFAPGSIKLTVAQGVAQAVTNDASSLFPQGCVVLEITGATSADPQAAYGGFLYDATANTLTAPPPPSTVPQSVTPRQARLALLNAGLLDEVQATVDAIGGATQISWDYATEVNRSDPLITTLSTTLSITDAQMDALFVAAAAL
jgi:hypothetical protein